VSACALGAFLAPKALLLRLHRTSRCRQDLLVGQAVPWERHTWRVCGLTAEAFAQLPDKAHLPGPPFRLADRAWELRLLPCRDEGTGGDLLVVELRFAEVDHARWARLHQTARLAGVRLTVNGRVVREMEEPGVWTSETPQLIYRVPVAQEFPLPKDELLVAVEVRPTAGLY
jgi:hypothetical protein